MILQDLWSTVFRGVFVSLFILKMAHFNLIYYKNNIKFEDPQDQ